MSGKSTIAAAYPKDLPKLGVENLMEILNNMGDPVFVKDEYSRLVLVNDAFCETFSLPRKDIIGRTLAEDVTPDEREHFLRIDKQVLADGKEVIVQESLTVRGGETKTISTRKTRYIDANGNIFLVGIIRDITDLTRTHKQKLESEEQNKFNQFLLDAARVLSDPIQGSETTLVKLTEKISVFFSAVCDISVVSPATDLIEPQAVYHSNPDVRDIIQRLFRENEVKRGQGLVGEVIESGQEAFIQTVPKEMQEPPRGIDERIVPVSMMYVPMKGKVGVLGSLNLTRLVGEPEFTDRDRKQIRRLAEYLSLFLENALLRKEQKYLDEVRKEAELHLAEEKKWAEFKLTISNLLADVGSDLGMLLQTLCVRITEYFDVVCDIQLVNQEKQIIELVALHHHNNDVRLAIEETLTKRELEIGEGMVGNVVKTGKEFFVNQLPETLKVKSQKEGVNPLIIPSSFAYIPLKSHGQVLGTMDLTRLAYQEPISEKELDKMRDLADYAARFIENRMLQASQLKEIELRKRAEQKLARSTKMLEMIEADTRSMLNTIPIYIARVSKDFRYIFLNDFYQNLGVPPRKLEGKKLIEVIGEDRFNSLLPHFDKALEGQLVNYEYERESASGQLHYFNVSLAPDKSETGEIVGFFSCAVDITEKVLAERQITLTQDRLKTLSLNSGDAFFFHDQKQNILDVNEVATEMLGYSREELLSMRASDIDPRWSGTIYQKFLSELGINEPQTFYSTVVTKKGKRIPVEVRFVKRVESGEVYIQSLIRDRSEKFKQEQKLQQSEERLRLIFENVEDYIATVSEDGIFESINKTSQGHEQEDVIGTSVYDFYDNPEKEELLRSKFKSLVETGESFEIEDFYTGPDGSAFCYLRKFIPVTYNGKFFKCILIIRDVTAERLKEKAEMNAVLKGQEQERKRLGAELHDGIGQVLSAIVLQVSQLEASASKLEPDELNSEMNQLKQNLREAIKEVRNISHDLMPEMLESFGLEEAVKQVCNQLEKRTGIRVTFNVADLESRYDNAIEVNLFRIAQELVNNIQKHANCSKVFVNLIDHGNSLSLSVEDDGTGFQHNAKHEGIGLSNVRSRIAMLNGELEIESDENSGTLINIEVPKKTE